MHSAKMSGFCGVNVNFCCGSVYLHSVLECARGVCSWSVLEHVPRYTFPPLSQELYAPGLGQGPSFIVQSIFSLLKCTGSPLSLLAGNIYRRRHLCWDGVFGGNVAANDLVDVLVDELADLLAIVAPGVDVLCELRRLSNVAAVRRDDIDGVWRARWARRGRRAR